ncbi:MAG: XRE family transcriptional regulator [Lachnospiraceae bacterium]|nr:XRE family transcriptional regulator [Lachnospiraceae bacterium]
MELYEYFRELREEHGLTIKQLSEGICSDSYVKLFETGQRELNEFALFRLMERLEIGEGSLQFFLKKKEHELWVKRMEIIDAIRKGEYTYAEEKIKKWKEQNNKKDKYADQFLRRMHSFCLIHRKAEAEEVCQEIVEAIKITVPDFETGWKNKILSEQELDMMLDYYHYSGNNHVEDICCVINYMKLKSQSFSHNNILIGKAVTYYIEELLRVDDVLFWSKEQVINALELCSGALEALRKAECGLYLLEILEIRKRLLVEVQRRGIDENIAKLEQCECWITALEKGYDSIGISRKTQEILRLYTMVNVESISDVIRRRRLMLGISVEELAKDLCDVRTIKRIESGETTPQTLTGELLLERLHLPRAWVKGSFLSYDIDSRKRMRELIEAYSQGDYREVLRIVEREKLEASASEAYNLQNMEWYKIEAEYFLKSISKDETIQLLKNNLSKSIRWKSIIDSEGGYVTLTEAKHITAILQIMDISDMEFPRLIKNVDNYVNSFFETYREMNYSSMLYVAISILQGRYAEIEKYTTASFLCERLACEIQLHRDLNRLVFSSYNLWWNKNEQKKMIKEDRPSFLVDLSNLALNTKRERFLHDKFNT